MEKEARRRFAGEALEIQMSWLAKFSQSTAEPHCDNGLAEHEDTHRCGSSGVVSKGAMIDPVVNSTDRALPSKRRRINTKSSPAACVTLKTEEPCEGPLEFGSSGVSQLGTLNAHLADQVEMHLNLVREIWGRVVGHEVVSATLRLLEIEEIVGFSKRHPLQVFLAALMGIAAKLVGSSEPFHLGSGTVVHLWDRVAGHDSRDAVRSLEARLVPHLRLVV